MTDALKPDDLIKRLVRAGEIEVSGESLDQLGDYFDADTFHFHGPNGFETDFQGLSDYFISVRAAFEDRSIRRGLIVVQGDLVACQTWIEGVFVRAFTHSPVGPLQPNGARIVMDLMNIFRFDAKGRLIEEHVRIDNRGLLEQLGAAGR